MEITIEQAMNRLEKAMKDDPEYAWSWHCNIAMVLRDEIMDLESGWAHMIANKAASRFMRQAFGVDTKEPSSG